MTWILRFLFRWISDYAKVKAVSKARQKGLLVYLKTIQGTRRAIIGVIVGIVALQVMILSGFGALITGILLWDHEFAAKIEILFWIFAGMFFVPLLILIVLLSERLWFKISGAQELGAKLRLW